jgi:NDP-sugar pyrophosphorylase family protein
MKLIGMGLLGGFGERLRPLTLKASTRIRVRAEARFLGRPAVRIQLATLKAGGIHDFILASKSREVRFAVRNLVGHGDDWDLTVRYTPPRHDHLDRGAADAVIRAAEHFELQDDLLVFPVDTLLATDLAAAHARHTEQQTLLTVFVANRRAGTLAPGEMALDVAADGRIRGPVPSEASALAQAFGPAWPTQSVPVVTGFYLINARELRQLALNPELARLRRQRLDFSPHLLRWALACGRPVQTWQVDWAADLGQSEQFLSATVGVLDGSAVIPGLSLGPDRQPPQRVFTPTLGGPWPAGWRHLYLGHDTVVGRNCHIEDTYIGDECVIGHHVTLVGAHLDDGVIVGDGAVVTASLLGVKAEVRSSLRHPTRIDHLSAVGDEAVVEAGAQLSEVLVLPKARVPGDVVVHGPAVLRPDMATGADALRIRQLPGTHA